MKNPTIKEQQQLEFYAAIESMSRDETLEYCTNLIKNARKPNHTQMHNMQSMGKNGIVFSMNNFIMKGGGNGVIG
jgi:hypothetical protein|tara:strand:- start:525 stop:749 length:225 start_codon:yes stop_codon:yes gene_type:complete